MNKLIIFFLGAIIIMIIMIKKDIWMINNLYIKNKRLVDILILIMILQIIKVSEKLSQELFDLVKKI